MNIIKRSLAKLCDIICPEKRFLKRRQSEWEFIFEEQQCLLDDLEDNVKEINFRLDNCVKGNKPSVAKKLCNHSENVRTINFDKDIEISWCRECGAIKSSLNWIRPHRDR